MDIWWKKITLGECCKIYDGVHQTPEYVDIGVPFYSVENITNDDFVNTKFITQEAHLRNTQKYKIEKGDVLMTRIGSIGVCKYIDWNVDASFYVSLALLKCNKDILLPEYLVQFSQTDFFRKEILSNSLENAIPMKINLGKINDVKIYIPVLKDGTPDINKQKEIASILYDLDKNILEKKELINKKQNIKEGMLNWCFNNPEWEKISIEKISKFLTTNSISRDNLNYNEGNILNIHYGDVLIKYPCIIDTNKEIIPRINTDLEKRFSNFAKNGDIIMADAAEDETVGKVCELQNVENKKIISGLHTIWIRFKEGFFAPRYLGYYMNSPVFHNQLLQFMHGTKVVSLSKEDVKNTYIYYPVLKNGKPDIAYQKKIADSLFDSDLEIFGIKMEFEKCQHIKEGLIQKIFAISEDCLFYDS